MNNHSRRPLRLSPASSSFWPSTPLPSAPPALAQSALPALTASAVAPFCFFVVVLYLFVLFWFPSFFKRVLGILRRRRIRHRAHRLENVRRPSSLRQIERASRPVTARP